MNNFKKNKLGLMIMAACAMPATASPSDGLDILLTNDEGPNAQGVQELRAALLKAGHKVTLVTPLLEQRGLGSAMNLLDGRQIALTQPSGPGSSEWLVDATPTDTVRVALGAIVDPASIDLVIAGINQGEKVGFSSIRSSGAINAAMVAMDRNIPAIAVSAERLRVPGTIDTDASYPHIADFVLRLIEHMDQTRTGGKLLPPFTMLNVNYPVFPRGSDSVAGRVSVTRVNQSSNIEFIVTGNPAVSGAATVTAMIDQDNYSATGAGIYGDRAALQGDNVSVTLLDGNMSVTGSSSFESFLLAWRLLGLEPYKPAEAANPDSDGDGFDNVVDAFPFDPAEWLDSDGDGVGDNADDLPLDPTETVDSDGDGVGDNSDLYPNDASESADTDGDGVGDNADAFANDIAASVDSDNDGAPDGWNPGYSENDSTTGLFLDAFPNDPTETTDSDGDGVGNNSDADPNDPDIGADSDGDGVVDVDDLFPNNASESADADGDCPVRQTIAPGNLAVNAGDGCGDNADRNYCFSASNRVITAGQVFGDYTSLGNAELDSYTGRLVVNEPDGLSETFTGGGSILATSAIISSVYEFFLNDPLIYLVDNSGVDPVTIGLSRTTVANCVETGNALLFTTCGQFDIGAEVPAAPIVSAAVDSTGGAINRLWTIGSAAVTVDSVITLTPLSGGRNVVASSASCGIESIDSDGDGFVDLNDSFPDDPLEWLDSDSDGVGDNADALPFNPNETLDSDGDGFGDNLDAFPNDPERWRSQPSGSSGSYCYTVSNRLSITGQVEGDVTSAATAELDIASGLLVIEQPEALRETFVGSEAIRLTSAFVSTAYEFYLNDPAIFAIDDGGSYPVTGGLSNSTVTGCTETGEGLAFTTCAGLVLGEAVSTLPITSAAVDGSGGVITTEGTFNSGASTEESTFTLTPLTGGRDVVAPGASCNFSPIDSDGDGFADENDAFPDDPLEWLDSDGDGVGDNADAFPFNPNETLDSDGDGFGDNVDAFPNDPDRWLTDPMSGAGTYCYTVANRVVTIGQTTGDSVSAGTAELDVASGRLVIDQPDSLVETFAAGGALVATSAIVSTSYDFYLNDPDIFSTDTTGSDPVTGGLSRTTTTSCLETGTALLFTTCGNLETDVPLPADPIVSVAVDDAGGVINTVGDRGNGAVTVDATFTLTPLPGARAQVDDGVACDFD